MPKYVSKTYGKTNSKVSKASVAFDEIQNEGKTSSGTKKGFASAFPRKTPWSKTEKVVSKTSPVKNETSKGRKRRKVSNDDPFAFTDEVEITPSTSESKLTTSVTRSTVENTTSEVSDCKSTDDEAYSSSQELSESSSRHSPSKARNAPTNKSKGKKVGPAPRSPFKRFLKNNDQSLSPKKEDKQLSSQPLCQDLNMGEESREDEDEDISVPSIVRYASWPQHDESPMGDRLRVKREHKPLFTVVRNVKGVHECLESGGDQQFFDDVEYLLDGLKSSLPVNTRCSSALDLAAQCTKPLFRINLRAHGIIPKIFRALDDASSDKNLALCTSTLMYMLTQEKHIDLDSFILKLMLKLLTVKKQAKKSPFKATAVVAPPPDNSNKFVAKVRNILEKQYCSSATLVNLSDITAASLARESLLSLSSHNAGEWFNREIRTLGGLEIIVNTVSEYVNNLLQKGCDLYASSTQLQKIDRCLKLLESVTTHNPENQNYLVHCQHGALLESITSLFQICVDTIMDEHADRSDEKKDAGAVENSIVAVLKLALNLTHDFEIGSTLVGQQEGMIATCLVCVLQLPQYLSEARDFDILVLGLGLLINMMEHSKQNILTLIELDTEPCHESEDSSQSSSETDRHINSVEALMQLFTVREQMARNTEEMTAGLTEEEEEEELRPTKDGKGWICGDDIDVSLEEEAKTDTGDSTTTQKQTQESLEEEIGVALEKAGKHMEDSMVASYVALLIGCIIQDNEANQAVVRSLLPDGKFSVFVDVLKKFLGFMRLTSGTSGHAIEKIIKVLEKC